MQLESTYSIIHLLQLGGFFTSEARFNDFFKSLTKQQQTDITNQLILFAMERVSNHSLQL